MHRISGDYAVWDLSKAYEIDPESFYSKGRATPFAGEHVYGKCVRNVLGGKTIWDTNDGSADNAKGML